MNPDPWAITAEPKSVEELNEAEAKAEKLADAHRFALIAEVDAMAKCAQALHDLSDEAKRRAISWLDNAIYKRGNPSIYRNDEEPPF